MTVKELIQLLERTNPDVEVFASDVYMEGVFVLTGAIYNDDDVILTGETTS